MIPLTFQRYKVIPHPDGEEGCYAIHDTAANLCTIACYPIMQAIATCRKANDKNLADILAEPLTDSEKDAIPFAIRAMQGSTRDPVLFALSYREWYRLAESMTRYLRVGGTALVENPVYIELKEKAGR